MKTLLIQILAEEDDDNFTYIGLNAIAGYLEKNNVKYKLIKGYASDILNKIETYLDPNEKNIIGVNIMTSRYNETISFIRKLRKSKRFSSNSYIIAGGTHFTLMPKLLPPEIDCAVIGDGEETFMEILSFPQTEWPSIKGIAYHYNSEIILTPPREPIALDELPFPRFEVSKLKINGITYRASAISTSKGCPYKCIYCNVNTLHKKVRFNSAEYVFDLIKDRVNRGCNLIIICDDLFVGNKIRLKEIAELLKKERLNVKFMIMGVRANLVNEELASILAKMGVVHANLGLESGSDRILKKLKNGVCVADNYRAVRFLTKSGITCYCMFMLGHPDERIKDIKATLKLIKYRYVRNGQVFITTPMPKTQLWYDCGLENNFNDLGTLDFVYGYEKNISKHLTKKQLQHYQKKATNIISRKKIIDRIKEILRV